MLRQNLPLLLQKNGRFCCWRGELRNDRITKVPYDPKTGAHAKSNDPTTFTTIEEALKVVDHYDGVGLGIFGNVCAIDLDHCISDSGYYTQEAAEIVELMHSYTEISPSGDGLHIFCCVDSGFHFDKDKY